MAIPPISSVGVGQIGGAGPAAPTTSAPPSGSKGFGNLLADEIGKLSSSQQQATTAAQQLASGQATDISTVAMEVEQASLSLQLAVQVRNKVVDAYQELLRMQI